MITTERICEWLSKIESEKMPAPVWIQHKHVFEYGDVDEEVVAFLKMARATQSLHSLPLLAGHGLTSDFGAIVRVIIECLDDVLFLLEGNPETANNVSLFVQHFRGTTIDNAKESTHQPVSRSKIHNAASRALSGIAKGTIGGFGDEEKLMKELRANIWNAWCNSVHANYAEIMHMYGPLGPHARFQLRGIPGDSVSPTYFQWIEAINLEAAFTLWFMAMKLGIEELAEGIYREIQRN